MSVEGMIDAVNALVKEAQVVLKNIAGSDVLVNKEQWSVIWMKEEYHTKFVTILQIIYQWERLVCFSNHIAITLNLANKGKKINWCSIMLTQMSMELTRWTEHQKKIVARLTTHEGNNLLFWTNYRSLFMTLGCSHNNTYHNKCNVYLVLSCFKVIIQFDVEIIRFVCIVVFFIYHGNMRINLKLIQWIKN